VQQELLLSSLIGHASVIGAQLETRGQATLRVGSTVGTATATVSRGADERLSLWVAPSDGEAVSPLGRLLRLYLFLTGAVILLVVYIALTRLIVRPIEKLTLSVERLPAGADKTAAISVAGAAEVARLAVSFNAMARELRLEKQVLVTQLAEIEETTRVLRSTQDQLIRSEKLAGVGRLAAGIAHEIGNPLAAILGLVELLQLGSLSRSEEAEFLARIRSETERIHHIIRELLDYARLPPGSSDAAASAPIADLERVVEEAVGLVSPQRDLRRVTLERRVYGGSLSVRGSAHELTQIVLNLLLNAADAVGGDGHILIELARKDGYVKLSISDTGPGIAASVLDKLFDPFVTTKPAGKGTGLGLAVCQSIVERLGGSISCENLPREGARFTVLLPAPAALQ
jgi:two-component system, NtrC family, sensor kinase